MNNYPIGDFVIRLKNAAAAGKVEVSAPYSRLKEEMAKVLVKEGYLSSTRRDLGKRVLVVSLSYKGKTPFLSGAKNVSRPGVRIYARSRELPVVAGGIGVTLVSTSKGVMTGKDARKRGLGGEVIAQIW